MYSTAIDVLPCATGLEQGLKYICTSQIHQEKVQLILCPFVTWLFLHYSAFFCFYLFLLLFLSLILKKVEKGLQKVAKAEKAMPPYPFASFFSVLK